MPDPGDAGRAGTDRVASMEADSAVRLAIDALRRGGVISFPTDTVYGLAASLAQPPALVRLFQIKSRPETKPIPILLSSTSDLRTVAEPVPSAVLQFVTTFWPGPVTFILPARDEMPDAVVGHDDAGRRTVAVRVPDHPGARALIQQAGGAMAATSANLSGAAPALTADNVAAQLGERVDLILDGGPSPGGVASTIVALGSTGPTILREGDVSADQLTAAWLSVTSRFR